MRHTLTRPIVVLAFFVAAFLVSCAGEGNRTKEDAVNTTSQQSTSETAVKETAAKETTTKETTTEETTTEETKNYTDIEFLKQFGTFTDTKSGKSLLVGVSTVVEVSSWEADGISSDTVVEPGKGVNGYGYNGGNKDSMLDLMIYNNTDAPLSVEDCIFAGYYLYVGNGSYGFPFEFANGLGSTSTAEDYEALLGPACEIKGNMYIWMDEDEKIVLQVKFGDAPSIRYTDRTVYI